MLIQPNSSSSIFMDIDYIIILSKKGKQIKRKKGYIVSKKLIKFIYKTGFLEKREKVIYIPFICEENLPVTLTV